MSTRRPRLDPAIFHLPVERMREGYYSDKYFVRARDVLDTRPLQSQGDGPGLWQGRRDPRRNRRSDRHPQAVQCRLERAPGQGASRRRRNRALGSRARDRGALRPLRTTRNALLWACWHDAPVSAPTRAVWSRRPAPRKSCSFPARHDHWLVQTGDGYAAHIAGAIGVSTDAQASWWGSEGIGTVPHGLIAAYGGDTVLASKKFVEHMDPTSGWSRWSTSKTTASAPRSNWPRRSGRRYTACASTPARCWSTDR